MSLGCQLDNWTTGRVVQLAVAELGYQLDNWTTGRVVQLPAEHEAEHEMSTGQLDEWSSCQYEYEVSTSNAKRGGNCATFFIFTLVCSLSPI